MFYISFVKSQSYDEQLSDLEEKAFSFFYTNKDSTYYFFNSMYQLAKEKKDHITIIDNLNQICQAAGYHYDIDKLQNTLIELDTLITLHSSILDTLPDKGAFHKNYFLYNKGNFYHKIENYDQSQIYFDSIVKNIISQPDYEKKPDDLGFLSTCYSFIAQINSLQNRFEIASDYYQKNIRLYKKFMTSDIEGLHKVYNLYANSLYSEKKYQEAKKYWLSSLVYAEKNYSENKRNSLVSTGLLLSTAYKDLGQVDSAFYYLKKVEKYKIKNDPFSDRYLTVRGDIYAKEKQFDKAQNSFKQALAVSMPSDKPRIRKKIGDLYVEMGAFDDALKNYQLGLMELTKDFNSDDLSKNPEPIEINQKQLFLQLLGSKAKTLNKNKHYESATLQTVDLGVKTIDILKPTFKNQSDKMLLIEDAFPLFESGMEVAFQMFTNENDQTYINKAFQYVEKSKAVILLDALLTASATKFANIPNDMVEKESQLKSLISHLKKSVETTSEVSVEKADELFSLQQDYSNLINTFETIYPAYYNLRYDHEVATVSSIQSLLSKEEQMIAYFYGNKAIYTLGLTSDSSSIHRNMITPELEKQIKSIHKKLGNPKSDVSVLTTESFSLYEKLLLPVLKQAGKSKLIIIPDGLLNYIPFGALSTSKNDVRYLMEDATIAYANSATLWSQLKERRSENNSVLAFAPSFEGNTNLNSKTRSNLLPLPHNTREVEQILTSFDGKSFLNSEGSLSNFNDELSKHGIIHLATHAIFNDESPEYSYLAFSPEDEEESVLYVRDLYNLNLNVGMVTLSACESGIGELKRGEGFLSLARGFFYSGAASIASTLWKVNDASSTTLMDSFYKNLADGDPKDLALQKGKKQFLETNRQNGLSHPYYWSGFIISGNTAPLVTTTNNWLWLLLGFVSIAGFMIFKKVYKR